jgi:hypothetical protein
MASILTDEQVNDLRRIAKSAEPYPPGAEEVTAFDIALTPEQQKRVDATLAREALSKR